MEDTVAAYAKALEMEKGKGEDGLGSLLSPTEMGIRQTATSDVPPDFEEIMSKVLPGQYVVGNGSTIYNPNRSDPRVERIYGEKRYKVKVPDNSPEKMQNTIVELTNKVNMLTSMVAGQPVPQPIKTKEEIAEEAQGGMTEADFNAMKYQDLVHLAKSLGLPLVRNISKEACIKLILDAKNR